jgi:multimeric flavodoxin WrbA/nitrite reductase/ring-hydroxylating ferredoxin subunit
MGKKEWHDLGPVEILKSKPLQEIKIGNIPIAISYLNGKFGAISGVCNHVGGPLGQGKIDGEYIVCPWHNWKFHFSKGTGEPGFEEDQVPQYELKEKNGHLFLNLNPLTNRKKSPHPPHPLSRRIERAPGAVRVLGISTTIMDAKNPRYSGSDDLLNVALEEAKSSEAETKLLRLNDLKFRHCEGYYSKSARACTWPCSITQMSNKDQMDQVYEAMIFWADVILVATPIRWGNASSLYYKMVERMNCIQNQITLSDRVLMKNKVAAFIIVGGQDNVQAVAGQMLMFFSEIGCHFPQFPFIGHSLGWSAENMERNIESIQKSRPLREGAKALVGRALEMSKMLLAQEPSIKSLERGGRKGCEKG